MKHGRGDWRAMARAGVNAAGAGTPSKGTKFQGQVTGVNIDNETVTIAYFGGEDPAPVRHPYLGVNAWMRIMPETGTGVIASHRFDSSGLDVDGYSYDTASRLEAYSNETGTAYRKLAPGEFDIKSPGQARVLGTRRGDLELRGGISWIQVRNERMQIESKAPLHRRSHPWQAHTSLGAEERFGVVMRKGLVTTVAERLINAGPFAAMEYYRSLYTLNPVVKDQALVVAHEGNVLDDNGLPVTGGPVSAPLRGFYAWRDEVGGEMKVEIDVVGNTLVELPITAVAGLNVKSPLMLKLDSTGAAPTSRIYLDGVNWWHGHAGPFGLTSGPVPLNP